MKLISTVVRPERLPQVKAALFRAGVTGITISRVSGHGGERELQEHYRGGRSEEHTSELQSPCNLVCRLLLEKKKKKMYDGTLYADLTDKRLSIHDSVRRAAT